MDSLRLFLLLIITIGDSLSDPEFWSQEPLTRALQLTYSESVNETVDFVKFTADNLFPALRGKSLGTVKLSIPRLGSMTVNDNQKYDSRSNCEGFFTSVYGKETELDMTDSEISKLFVDRIQAGLTICTYVVKSNNTAVSLAYGLPTLVIYLTDPTWSTSPCQNNTEPVCDGFNSSAVIMMSSTILGSGKCCRMDLNITNGTGIVRAFIKTNGTDTLRQLAFRESNTGSESTKKFSFIGRQRYNFQIIVVYDADISTSLKIVWKNCMAIERVIHTTLPLWSYNTSDLTIYDEFCDCNNTLIQVFSCQGPQKGLVLRNADQLTTITSNVMTSFNPQCHLSMVITTTFKTYIGVAILSFNRTRFPVFRQNRDGDLYTHYRREYKIPIGHIEEEFRVQIDLQRLQLNSLLGLESAKLINCTETSSSDEVNCSSTEYKCKTGVCIEKWKRCNLAKDCYHGDDEMDCGEKVGLWKCDFDVASNKTCGFLQYEKNQCGEFRITRGSLFGNPGPEHTNMYDKGDMLYFERKFCRNSFSAEIKTKKFNYALSNLQGDKSKCTITVASKGENSCWWNLYLCQESCLKRLFRGNTTKEWRTDVVSLPVQTGSYFVKIKAKEMCDWMAIDDLFFSPSCFAPENRATDMTWWISIIVPVVCLIVLLEIAVVSWAVCQRTLSSNRIYDRFLGICIRKKHPEVKDFVRESCVSPSSIARFNELLTESNPNYALLSERALKDCVRNIPFMKVCLDSLLGEGSFGQVYKGKLLKYGDFKDDIPVAIKKLPAGSMNENVSDFLFEALTLSKFDHINIVGCLGITSDPKGELLLILELMEGGDLRKYLRDHRKNEDLSVQELLKISLDIAHGCQYLEENKFIHRDIAARNCLLSSLDANKIAKIGDFGFAKDIYGTDYYKKCEMTMVPVRWMPEESFKNGKFSSRSDVWAYGVLLWEIFAFGQLPYEDLTNCEVMAKVMNGHRMGQPRHCPIQVYNVMGECWKTEPDKRPGFKTVVTLLTSIYTHTFSQIVQPNSNGIFSMNMNGGKHRLNTYSLPEETETVMPLLEGDCNTATTDDNVFEANSSV
ncbi:uncharacterized protein LOC134232846 [Saccostrea cucullata]|uniref:uncharacterized protein LOC134232846 n=1 Tax=Saccostrea cuccullata TaxID=36930 RepID=UPI002ED6AE64